MFQGIYIPSASFKKLTRNFPHTIAHFPECIAATSMIIIIATR